MPTYVYKCPECDRGYMYRIVRDMWCTKCGTLLKRDYQAESVHAAFKGSGWARKT